MSGHVGWCPQMSDVRTLVLSTMRPHGRVGHADTSGAMDSWSTGTDAPERAGSSQRFDSWKEIAAYFGRDVRTVRRWEQEEALPVHRHVHRSRGSVYAFQRELDAWHSRRSAPPIPRNRTPSHRLFVIAGLSAVLGLSGWAFVHAYRAPRPSAPAGATHSAATEGTNARARQWVTDPALLERFQLARHHLARRIGFRLEARQSLEAVVAGAPAFADAHALLGEAYLRQALSDRAVRNEAWARAETSVNRALALDGNLATAHAVLSRIRLFRDWDFSAAATESRRAIELDPDAPEARSAHALYLRASGRVAEAIVERERAHRSDPMNPQWIVFLGDEYQFDRRFGDAVAMYQKALQLERDYRPAVASLADVYPRMGRYADAAAWQWRWLILRGENDLAAAFDEVRHREGPQAAMNWIDRSNVDEFRRSPDEHAWDLAYLSARLGRREAALQFLQRAYELHEAGMLQARVDPDLDSVRGEARFGELLALMGGGEHVR